MRVTRLVQPDARSRACRLVIDTLPDWFGIPKANMEFCRDVAEMECIAAEDGTDVIGMVAMKLTAGSEAEVHWMGVRPEWHRKGVGTLLMEGAVEWARGKGCPSMVVETLSPRDPDPGYAATRAFYAKCGFTIFEEFNLDDPVNPMCRMRRML